MVALVSMMAKSGKLSYRDLIGALVVKSATGIPRKLSASSLLKMTNVGYLESLISSLVRGKELPRANAEVIDYEETFFKNEVFKRIVNYLNTWDDRKITPFSWALIKALFPSVPEGDSLDAALAVDKLSTQRSKVEQIIFLFYRLLFVNLKLDLKYDLEQLEEAVKTKTVVTPDPVKYPNAKRRFTSIKLPTYTTTIEA